MDAKLPKRSVDRKRVPKPLKDSDDERGVHHLCKRGFSPNPHQDCSAGVTRPTRSAQEQSRSHVLIFHAALELRLHPRSPHVLKCPLLLGLVHCGQLRLLRIYLIYTDATPSASRALGLFLLAGWLSVSVLGPQELLSACARNRNWPFSSVSPVSIFSFVSKAGGRISFSFYRRKMAKNWNWSKRLIKAQILSSIS